MMKKINNIIVGVSILITLISVGVSFYLYNRKSELPIVDKNAIIKAEATIIAKKVDKNGLQHTIVEYTNNVLPKNLEKSEGKYPEGFVDSLISVTDIQKKEITSLSQINQTIIGKNKQAVAVIDSLYHKKFEYSDKNFYVSYTPISGDSSKVGKFDYRYNQNLNIIAYNRKKWLLGQDRNYIDISTDDINSTINNMKIITVKQPPKNFGAVLTARSVYLPQQNVVGVGGQLRVRYKRVTATGSQLYFPTTQKWLPVIGAEFDVFNY